MGWLLGGLRPEQGQGKVRRGRGPPSSKQRQRDGNGPLWGQRDTLSFPGISPTALEFMAGSPNSRTAGWGRQHEEDTDFWPEFKGASWTRPSVPLPTTGQAGGLSVGPPRDQGCSQPAASCTTPLGGALTWLPVTTALGGSSPQHRGSGLAATAAPHLPSDSCKQGPELLLVLCLLAWQTRLQRLRTDQRSSRWTHRKDT